MTKGKKVFLILGIIITGISLVLLGMVAVQFGNDLFVSEKNKAAAEEVMEMIEELDDEKITVDSEELVMDVKNAYDDLTNKQQKLVENYDDLEKALNELQSAKDKAAADEIINEINKIKPSTVTADNTEVEELLTKFESLTEPQKALVTNISTLREYKTVIENKRTAKALAENFQAYDGKWGGFGAHINEYQGMVEKALHENGVYAKIYKEPLYSLDFNITRFRRDETGFGFAYAYFSFYGTSKRGYDYYHEGTIIIKEDGTVYCDADDYYYNYY